MIIKETNKNKFTFTLSFVKLPKICEQTGYVYTEKPQLTRLPINLGFDNHIWQQSILISDIEQVIEWFDSLLLNNVVKDIILTNDKQLKFELLENNPNYKKVKITHDSSIPVQGMGAYSLAPGLKYEDVFKKLSIEYEMDRAELQRIVEELKNEFNDSNRVVWK
ncbi:hypothetical protein PG911_11730 [Tenacibaculum ovolyticum]|uniref:hypothetical protein n=1 Tax=Tenacibaculum ovolyticum TaxID=104270 RepID=UPI0022F3E237|nr:hypothetical protein [Tenacibaculum ovolyticum]WBX75326.1 hypothetical protein PG911_11730 [Tenacibaculum ovolyticum]